MRDYQRVKTCWINDTTMENHERQTVERFVNDLCLYEKWLAHYLEQGFEIAPADELAYLKACNNEEISENISTPILA